jgi:hypothetical protein
MAAREMGGLSLDASALAELRHGRGNVGIETLKGLLHRG